MYEEVGFIVHFFSEQKVKQLAEGYQIVDIEEFEEGELPRKLFRVTLRASGDAASRWFPMGDLLRSASCSRS